MKDRSELFLLIAITATFWMLILANVFNTIHLRQLADRIEQLETGLAAKEKIP